MRLFENINNIAGPKKHSIIEKSMQNHVNQEYLLKKRNNYIKQLFLLVANIFFMSCGDSESLYITSIKNNTNFEMIVHFRDNSIIECPSKQETIIEKFWGSSVKNMKCTTPYIFNKRNISKIIINGGNRILTKNISDDNNWNCNGDKAWSLIMVGSFYANITTTFIINDEDIKSAEQ